VGKGRNAIDYSNPYAAPVSPLAQRKPQSRPERTVTAWALRYMLVGAAIGLILPLFVFSTIPFFIFMPVYGAVIGSVFGCLAGIFVRWDRNGDGDRNGDAASIDGGHGSLVSGTEMNRETSCVPVSFL
jgi:hypothetical protein